LPSKAPVPQIPTPLPYAPGYQVSQATGNSTGWSRGITKRGISTPPRDTNKKTQLYTPQRYGDIWVDTRASEPPSSSYSNLSSSGYPKLDSSEQQTTEALPTQSNQTSAEKKSEPKKLILPQVTTEKTQESEEETTPTYKKRQFPEKEVIEKEESPKPVLNWLWRLIFWIKKQFTLLTNYVHNIFIK
jgi:hypothetical protein